MAAGGAAAAGLAPLRLGPKEGLALLNGTQVSTALALCASFAVERAMAGAFVAGAGASAAVSAVVNRVEPRESRSSQPRPGPSPPLRPRARMPPGGTCALTLDTT